MCNVHLSYIPVRYIMVFLMGSGYDYVLLTTEATGMAEELLAVMFK